MLPPATTVVELADMLYTFVKMDAVEAALNAN